MHVCDTCSPEEVEFLRELLELGVGEAKDSLAKHEGEPPPYFDSQTMDEAASSYLQIIDTARRRLVVLERVLEALNGR